MHAIGKRAATMVSLINGGDRLNMVALGRARNDEQGTSDWVVFSAMTEANSVGLSWSEWPRKRVVAYMVANCLLMLLTLGRTGLFRPFGFSLHNMTMKQSC